MKGILEYSSTETGTYNYVGTIRSRKRKGYNVEAITGQARDGEIEKVAFRITVTVLALELHTNFLTAEKWYFRIHFNAENKEIKLGQHYYTIDYDGLVILNEIEYHQVQVSFIIDYDKYSDYAIPQTISGP